MKKNIKLSVLFLSLANSTITITNEHESYREPEHTQGHEPERETPEERAQEEARENALKNNHEPHKTTSSTPTQTGQKPNPVHTEPIKIDKPTINPEQPGKRNSDTTPPPTHEQEVAHAKQEENDLANEFKSESNNNPVDQPTPKIDQQINKAQDVVTNMQSLARSGVATKEQLRQAEQTVQQAQDALDSGNTAKAKSILDHLSDIWNSIVEAFKKAFSSNPKDEKIIEATQKLVDQTFPEAKSTETPELPASEPTQDSQSTNANESENTQNNQPEPTPEPNNANTPSSQDSKKDSIQQQIADFDQLITNVNQENIVDPKLQELRTEYTNQIEKIKQELQTTQKISSDSLQNLLKIQTEIEGRRDQMTKETTLPSETQFEETVQTTTQELEEDVTMESDPTKSSPNEDEQSTIPSENASKDITTTSAAEQDSNPPTEINTESEEPPTTKQQPESVPEPTATKADRDQLRKDFKENLKSIQSELKSKIDALSVQTSSLGDVSAVQKSIDSNLMQSVKESLKKISSSEKFDTLNQKIDDALNQIDFPKNEELPMSAYLDAMEESIQEVYEKDEKQLKLANDIFEALKKTYDTSMDQLNTIAEDIYQKETEPERKAQLEKDYQTWKKDLPEKQKVIKDYYKEKKSDISEILENNPSNMDYAIRKMEDYVDNFLLEGLNAASVGDQKMQLMEVLEQKGARGNSDNVYFMGHPYIRREVSIPDYIKAIEDSIDTVYGDTGHKKQIELLKDICSQAKKLYEPVAKAQIKQTAIEQVKALQEHTQDLQTQIEDLQTQLQKLQEKGSVNRVAKLKETIQSLQEQVTTATKKTKKIQSSIK